MFVIYVNVVCKFGWFLIKYGGLLWEFLGWFWFKVEIVLLGGMKRFC